MARHAYLSRMALGRSAYDPPERSASPSPEPRPSNEPEEGDDTSTPPQQMAGGNAAIDSTSEPDAQQYNERGRPINPRSRAYARDMRAAQNDVLACVGVCVRSAPSGPSPGDVQDNEIHELVSSETMYGSIVGIVGILAKYAGVWWTSSLRDRLLVFAFPAEGSFTQIVAEEYQRAGPMAFLFAGFPAHLVSLILNDGNIWSTVIVEIIDEQMLGSSVSRRTRRLWQRVRQPFRWSLAITIEVLFTPILVHVNLQKLHLIPARQLLPSWRSFLPSSFALSMPYSDHPSPRTLPGMAFWAKSFATSPLVLLQAWRQVMNQTQSVLYPLFASSILIPDNPDRFTVDIERREDVEAPDGKPLRVFQGIMASVGWGDSSNRFTWPSARGILSGGSWWNTRQDSPSSEPSGSNDQPRLSHTPPNSPPASPTVVPQDQDRNEPSQPEPHLDTGNHEASAEEPPSPSENRAVSPASSNAPEDELPHTNDATIRIAPGSVASGTVNLEIALPDDAPARRNSVVLHDGQAQAISSTSHSSPSSRRGRRRRSTPHHRVTPLSEEPADMLATLLNGFTSGWLFIPVKGFIVRQIAAIALTHDMPSLSRANAPLYPLWPVVGGPWTPGWANEVGRAGAIAFTGKVALCCAAEMAISFALWGVQWGVITWTGRKWYQWGRL